MSFPLILENFLEMTLWLWQWMETEKNRAHLRMSLEWAGHTFLFNLFEDVTVTDKGN